MFALRRGDRDLVGDSEEESAKKTRRPVASDIDVGGKSHQKGAEKAWDGLLH